MAGISDALGERFDQLDMPFHRYGADFFDYRFVAHNPPVNVLGRVFQFSSDKLYVDPDPLRMVFFMVVDADAAIKDKPLDLHPLPSITDRLFSWSMAGNGCSDVDVMAIAGTALSFDI